MNSTATGVPGMTGPIGVAASGGVSKDPNVIYSLGSSEGETARLQRQADELTPDSRALLDRAELRPGQSRSTSAAARAGFSTY
jgi:hypothetical protein